eukprot:SAG22_NODE_6549_length_840_cov_1.863698_2_plen_130_part_00
MPCPALPCPALPCPALPCQVSDYDAFANIFGAHKYTKDMEHAAAAGLNAGLDQEGGGTAAISELPAAVAAGLTTAAAVDAAFGRLMVRREAGSRGAVHVSREELGLTLLLAPRHSSAAALHSVLQQLQL